MRMRLALRCSLVGLSVGWLAVLHRYPDKFNSYSKLRGLSALYPDFVSASAFLACLLRSHRITAELGDRLICLSVSKGSPSMAVFNSTYSTVTYPSLPLVDRFKVNITITNGGCPSLRWLWGFLLRCLGWLCPFHDDASRLASLRSAS